jgi:transposase
MRHSNKRFGKSNGECARMRRETERPIVKMEVAGVDVSKADVWVCISSEKARENVRQYRTFTGELEKMAGWLLAHGIKEVAFEATGSYWIQLYRILRRHGLRGVVFLPGTLKGFQRPKTDPLDCQWIWRLQAQGMLKHSFVPEGEIAEIRVYDRQKEEMSRRAGDCVRHMQKALTVMNIKLDVVLSNITGKSGMGMIRAILAGEREASALARYRDRRVQASAEEVEQALVGVYSEEQLFILRQAVQQWDFIQAQEAECDVRIGEVLARLAAKRKGEIGAVKWEEPDEVKKSVDSRKAGWLAQIFGVDVTRLTGIGTDLGISVLGETGYDMSLWETEKRHASWTRLAPRVARSGGKDLKSKGTRPITPRIGRLFKQAAVAARNTETMIGAKYRRLRKRKSGAVAAHATAHDLQGKFYRMVKARQSYQEIGAAEYDLKFREREVKNLEHRAQRLGMKLVAAA